MEHGPGPLYLKWTAFCNEDLVLFSIFYLFIKAPIRLRKLMDQKLFQKYTRAIICSFLMKNLVQVCRIAFRGRD